MLNYLPSGEAKAQAIDPAAQLMYTPDDPETLCGGYSLGPPQTLVWSTATFEERVRRIVDEWQRRLRLMDWDLVVEIENHDNPYYAVTEVKPHYQAAKLKFTHEDFYEKVEGTAAIQDIEATVVHELLHVRTGNLPADVHQILSGNSQWEAAVELIAQALVAAKRGQERLK